MLFLKRKKLKTVAVAIGAAAIHLNPRFHVPSYTFWNQQGISVIGAEMACLGAGRIHSPNAKPGGKRKWEIHYKGALHRLKADFNI